MEVKLRGLDRYEVEAIQYDGTNSDEICQFILEHEPDTQIEGAFNQKGVDKKMMAAAQSSDPFRTPRRNTGVRRNNNQRKPKPVVRELREFTVKGHTIMAYSRKDAIIRLKLKKKI